MKKAKTIDFNAFVETHMIYCDVSYRGGAIKVDVSELLDTGEEDAIMGAYQNYLGGGIAGRIQIGTMFDPDQLSDKDAKVFTQLSDAIKQYFYSLNNGGGDEYMQEEVNSFELNQILPINGY